MTFLLKLFAGARSLFSGLWGYIAVAFTAVGAIALAYMRGHEAAEDAIEAKSRKKAAKVRTKAHKAHIKGIQRDKQIRKKPVDTKRRDYFSK